MDLQLKLHNTLWIKGWKVCIINMRSILSLTRKSNRAQPSNAVNECMSWVNSKKHKNQIQSQLAEIGRQMEYQLCQIAM